jgi:hypothetical protein
MGCAYACVSMIVGEDLDGDALSVNQMKVLLEEKTNEKWAIHGTVEDDKPEHPKPIPLVPHQQPTLYLITPLTEPFEVNGPIVLHWIILYNDTAYDPEMPAPFKICEYPKRHWHFLRAIKQRNA